MIWLGLALATEPADIRPVRPGRIDLRAGFSGEFSFIGGGSVLSVIEGWQSLHALGDLSLFNAGGLTFGVGAETAMGKQFFVNRMMRVRRLWSRVGLGPGDEGDYHWEPTTWMVAGRLLVHIHALEGRPYVVTTVERHQYSVQARHLETDETFSLDTPIWGFAAGVGATRSLSWGGTMGVELRYGFPLVNGERPYIDPDGADVRIPRRMRPPARVTLAFTFGFRG